MSNDLKIIANNIYKKVIKTITLVNASLENLEPYNSEIEYSPVESMPYDALSGRFIRSVEMCTKFFRIYERIILGDSSDTYRQLLNNMCKIQLITHLTHSPLERGRGVFFFLFKIMNLGTRCNSLNNDLCVLCD